MLQPKSTQNTIKQVLYLIWNQSYMHGPAVLIIPASHTESVLICSWKKKKIPKKTNLLTISATDARRKQK